MWFLRKIQDSAENIPVEMGRIVSKNTEEISAKTNLFNKLHSNVLTPDKIPDFFLPPKLTKRPLMALEGTAVKCGGQSHTQSQVSDDDPTKPAPCCVVQPEDANGATTVARRRKPLPFSLEYYNQSGLYESPNTRRKESLFHSAFTSYTLDCTTARPASRVVPVFHRHALLEGGGTESDTPSSAESSPLGSPQGPSRPLLLKFFRQEGPLSRSASRESLGQDMSAGAKNAQSTACGPAVCSRAEREAGPASSHHSGTPQPSSNFLAPPTHFPLEVLHCQKRLHREHMLPLPQGGYVRLSAECHSSSSSSSSCDPAGRPVTLRVRVVAVEGLREPGDLRPLHCCLTLCLTPGKLQRQHSAVIRNCRNPVFNEDFFFTGQAGGNLHDLELRLKVLDKGSSMGRGSVLGVISKPLSQLLPLLT